MRRIECSRCHRIKPENQFNKDSTRPSGRQSKCRDCQRLMNQRYRNEVGVTPRPLKEIPSRRVHFHLPIEWIRALDALAQRAGATRAETIRNIIAAALRGEDDHE